MPMKVTDTAMVEATRFPPRKAVDFVIIGSGSAGGILARELSMAGFSVVVLEQGRYRRTHEFNHDELAVIFNHEYVGGPQGGDPQTFRHDPHEEAVVTDFPPAYYARMVGGSSVHFSGNFWRCGRWTSGSTACWAGCRTATWRTGRWTTMSSSPGTRRSIGRSACRVRPDPWTRRAHGLIRCRRCP
jgi:choline dehydrogenase-like flavoprotein